MTGYWERPDETAHVLRDGWLFTGDVATMDEDGYFTIVDRLKDLIKVEDVLLTHPAVAEAAVVGIPDNRRGELPMAYVVLREGSTATAGELAQHCQANLSHYKWPARIEIRTELPKTMIGKVLRRMLTPEPLAAPGAVAGEAQPAEPPPPEQPTG